MARPEHRLPQNASGDFFVDSTCIDCDLCRQLASATFLRADEPGMSFVHRQPATPTERKRALMALVACPTASIGTADKTGMEDAVRAFPESIAPEVPNVLYCGFAAASSFGAMSYLVRRPGGNV